MQTDACSGWISKHWHCWKMSLPLIETKSNAQGEERRPRRKCMNQRNIVQMTQLATGKHTSTVTTAASFKALSRQSSRVLPFKAWWVNDEWRRKRRQSQWRKSHFYIVYMYSYLTQNNLQEHDAISSNHPLAYTSLHTLYFLFIKFFFFFSCFFFFSFFFYFCIFLPFSIINTHTHTRTYTRPTRHAEPRLVATDKLCYGDRDAGGRRSSLRAQRDGHGGQAGGRAAAGAGPDPHARRQAAHRLSRCAQGR